MNFQERLSLEGGPSMASAVASPSRKHQFMPGMAAAAEWAAPEYSDEELGPLAAGPMTNIIAKSKSKDASIIGITGTSSGVGVSTVSMQLARTFARFGKRTLLVDVSKVDRLPSEAPAVAEPNARLSDYATPVKGNISVVDLLGVPSGPPSEQALRAMFSGAVEQGMTIIVDLPPVVQPGDQPSAAFASVGALCDSAFLVCLTGAVSSTELNTCLATCRVLGVTLSGLILNDWQLPGNRLLPV